MTTHHPHEGTGHPATEPADHARITTEFFARDRFARHSGIELLEVSEGFARAKMPLGPFHHNGIGTVHGGALFTLADLAFAAASNSHGTVAVAVASVRAAVTGAVAPAAVSAQVVLAAVSRAAGIRAAAARQAAVLPAVRAASLTIWMMTSRSEVPSSRA